MSRVYGVTKCMQCHKAFLPDVEAVMKGRRRRKAS